MGLVFWVKRKLHRRAVDYHQRLYPVNPYQQHLEMLIKYRMVPFTSVDSLFENRIDGRAVRQIYLYTLVIVLNLFRLAVIVIAPTSPTVRYYFVHYLSGQANSWYFHLSLLATFAVPSVLCKYIFFINLIIASKKKINEKIPVL